MGKLPKRVVMQKFNLLDFHDDNLKFVEIAPPSRKSNSTSVCLALEDDASGVTKLLRFRGCGNVRFLMDFDVLASNWAAQTHRASSSADVEKMKKLVRSQTSHWRTQYMPPLSKNEPIRKKMMSIRNYLLFKLTFFGGVVEVLARDYSIRKLQNARR